MFPQLYQTDSSGVTSQPNSSTGTRQIECRLFTKDIAPALIGGVTCPLTLDLRETLINGFKGRGILTVVM